MHPLYIIYNLMTICQYLMNNILGLERDVCVPVFPLTLLNEKPTGKVIVGQCMAKGPCAQYHSPVRHSSC